MELTKRAVLCVLVGLVPALSSNAQDSLTNGLVAYYTFDGNANDVSGNGNNGTLQNGATFVADRFGNPASALSYDGSGGGAVQVPDSPTIRFGPSASITVALWVYRIAPYDAMHFIGKRHGCSGATPPPDLTYQMSLSTERNEGLAFNAGYPSGVWTGLTLAPNTWKHLVGTCDGATYRFYIDGGFITSANGTLGNAITDPLVIGASGTCQTFQGLLDDVRIYNRALSATEVAQLYAAPAFCSPHKARATAQVTNGQITGATITDPGCGYTNPPVVLIKGGGGTGATATATVTNGVVIAINITSAGCCYSANPPPTVEIGSPPFAPTVSIAFSKVRVTQNVVLGRNYVLESSTDLINWTPTGPPFTADSETIVNEFDIDLTGRFFRIHQVP